MRFLAVLVFLLSVTLAAAVPCAEPNNHCLNNKWVEDGNWVSRLPRVGAGVSVPAGACRRRALLPSLTACPCPALPPPSLQPLLLQEAAVQVPHRNPLLHAARGQLPKPLREQDRQPHLPLRRLCVCL
jgi:hypothetical protein